MKINLPNNTDNCSLAVYMKGSENGHEQNGEFVYANILKH
jgi:hypothetical protein